MKLRKKILNNLIIIFISLLVSVLTLEVSYRYQWFDFYKAELNGLNSKETLQSNKKKILICGDSYSASLVSYVEYLRDSLPEYAIINAAVPGTCILQHTIYMPRRIKKFKPDIFIYQFYVGNDLFDISHPVNTNEISLTRKAYWWLSDRLLSISFLNFRFAGIRYNYYDDAGGSYKPKENEIFSVANYSKREKLNCKAEPQLIENTLFLKNGRENDWLVFEKKFRKVVQKLKPECTKYFIIIPHQSQVNDIYCNQTQSIGVQFDYPIFDLESNYYPLYNKLFILCNELDFRVIDPLEQFRYDVSYEDLYYQNDPHLAPSGNRLLAAIILENILRNRIQ